MLNIQLFSQNDDFKQDLAAQLVRFIAGVDVESAAPDMIIVDDDRQLYAQKRAEYPSVPMLFLTTNEIIEEDNLNILVHKPLDLMHFLDVVRAANNKLDNSEDGNLLFNNYELRPSSREITDLLSAKTTKLTEKEVSIIKYLYKIGGAFASKADLQTNVWRYSEDVTTHTVETHIYRLRQKVESDDSRRIITTDNGKYKLNMD